MKHPSRLPEKMRLLATTIPADAECEYCGHVVGRRAREIVVNTTQKEKRLYFCNKKCKTEWRLSVQNSEGKNVE